MKHVFVPYDSMQDYYLDAYPTWNKAQDALEEYCKDFTDWEDEDDWKYYLSDECQILKFKLKEDLV
jgi:hypothetical protein